MGQEGQKHPLGARVGPPEPGEYPAPLILPGDDLALDPRCPPQDILSWQSDDDRNAIISQRKTVYVAGPPELSPEVDFIRLWSFPTTGTAQEADVPPPDVHAVLRYLEAFYHGLPVKLLPASGLKYAAWDDDVSSKPAPRRARVVTAKAPSKAKSSGSRALIPAYIALNTTTDSTRIRTRPGPKRTPFSAQLNLSDLLDVAISILPADGYALLLLVDQDLYEDDEDEFVCGRAYGGSRVAVVSSARYAPALDTMQGVPQLHAWPASHCDAYITEQCADDKPAPQRRPPPSSRNAETETTEPPLSTNALISPIRAAISAYSAFSATPTSPASLAGLWLGRVSKTASHELGHCFGIEHCVYYACVMQGSANLAEDARQPPYLCIVDEFKLGRAIGEAVAAAGMQLTGEEWLRAWRMQQRRALRRVFCDDRAQNMILWKAYDAWLEVLEALELDV